MTGAGGLSSSPQTYSLDKALRRLIDRRGAELLRRGQQVGCITYAAHHAAYYDLTNRAVYVTSIPVSEIYCCLDHYDHDCIAHPQSAWHVDVPEEEFRLDRPR